MRRSVPFIIILAALFFACTSDPDFEKLDSKQVESHCGVCIKKVSNTEHERRRLEHPNELIAWTEFDLLSTQRTAWRRAPAENRYLKDFKVTRPVLDGLYQQCRACEVSDDRLLKVAQEAVNAALAAAAR
jgi:hypothetical protein